MIKVNAQSNSFFSGVKKKAGRGQLTEAKRTDTYIEKVQLPQIIFHAQICRVSHKHTHTHADVIAPQNCSSLHKN